MPPSVEIFELVVNGETRQIDRSSRVNGSLTVALLLEQLELAGRRVAVAVNGAVVPRSRFGTAVVAEGDQVEVIQAVGGG